MYFSQPDIWPREPIGVTAGTYFNLSHAISNSLTTFWTSLETWNSILDFMDQCDERGCGGDGHTALTKLLNDEAFKFCALQSVKEASIFEQNSSYETQA
jgi:hypothetical protein